MHRVEKKGEYFKEIISQIKIDIKINNMILLTK